MPCMQISAWFPFTSLQIQLSSAVISRSNTLSVSTSLSSSRSCSSSSTATPCALRRLRNPTFREVQTGHLDVISRKNWGTQAWSSAKSFSSPPLSVARYFFTTPLSWSSTVAARKSTRTLPRTSASLSESGDASESTECTLCS